MTGPLPWLLLPALIQSQSTFYAAFEDGLELERRGEWRGALLAYQRAVALRPASANQVVIYGNNLLRNYHPYTRMARCHLELGEAEAAEAMLLRGQAHHEATKEWGELRRRVQELLAARTPRPRPTVAEPPPPAAEPAPAPKPPEPAPRGPEPGPDPVAESAPAATSAVPEPSGRSPERAGATPKLPPPGPSVDGRPASVPLPSPAAAPAAPPAPRWPWLLLLLPVAALLWRRREPRRRDDPYAEPERLGPYRIERLLGRGGFASTYLARHEATGQRVALKRLHPHRQDDAEFVGRFHQEAELGLRLRHPNLVPLVDPGPREGFWLAMEFVEGQRLDERLAAGPPFSLEEVRALALGLAEGLAYAHAHGVVHRDLKPANIMLTPEGVKIMDFGIARVMDAETLTTTYAFLGTPRYAAPEAQRKTTVGPAADRYALGIILFELLTGRPPFQGETPFDLLDQHRNRPLPDLADLRPDLPPEWIRLVTRLAAKAPDERPEDAEVVNRLRALAPRG